MDMQRQGIVAKAKAWVELESDPYAVAERLDFHEDCEQLRVLAPSARRTQARLHTLQLLVPRVPPVLRMPPRFGDWHPQKNVRGAT